MLMWRKLCPILHGTSLHAIRQLPELNTSDRIDRVAGDTLPPRIAGVNRGDVAVFEVEAPLVGECPSSEHLALMAA
jgi:hypothetical protein